MNTKIPIDANIPKSRMDGKKVPPLRGNSHVKSPSSQMLIFQDTHLKHGYVRINHKIPGRSELSGPIPRIPQIYPKSIL
jgi:hypothetical protein